MTATSGGDPRVSVVVVNWNHVDYLVNCLTSLREHAPSTTEVIVVDNASEDGSVQMVTSRFPEVRLVANDANEGWVGGVHRGVAASRGGIVLLLNNDTEVGPGCIERIVQRFDADPEVAIVGCVVRDLTDRALVREAGMSIDRFAFMIPFHVRRSDLPPFYVSGTGLAVRREAVGQLGLFDERYEVYAEDIDVCWRYRLAGRRVAVADGAVVYHAIGGSVAGGVKGSEDRYETSMRRVYLRERNAIATMLKNYSRISLVVIGPAYLILLAGEVVVALITLRPRWALQLVRAVAWNVANIRTTLALRRGVQKLRRVPDRALPFDNRLGKLLALRTVGIPKVVR